MAPKALVEEEPTPALERTIPDRAGGDGSEVSELFVDHKSEDSHHGGTAVVKLDGTLLELGLLIEGVPSQVNVSVTEVTDELVSGSRNILHETNFEESNEGDHLDKSGSRDGVRSDKGGNSVRVGVESISGVVDASRKVDSTTGGDLSKEGKHTNTSVLDLDVSETVELCLVTVFNESKRIEESKRRLGTELRRESLEGGGGSLLLGRGESSGGGDEGGKDGGLHGGMFCLQSIQK